MSALLLFANKAFMRRVPKNKRVPITCPHCSESHQGLKPADGEYTSITTCPHCDLMFFKRVAANGDVEVSLVKGLS